MEKQIKQQNSNRCCQESPQQDYLIHIITWLSGRLETLSGITKLSIEEWDANGDMWVPDNDHQTLHQGVPPIEGLMKKYPGQYKNISGKRVWGGKSNSVP